MNRPLYEELDSVQLEAWRLQRERAMKMEKVDIIAKKFINLALIPERSF